MIDAIGAIQSTKTQGVGTEALSGAGGVSGSLQIGQTGNDFTAMLSELATNAVNTVKSGEAASIAGIKGQASVQEVVRSVMAAEQTVQASIAIRDKVVSAYLELSRMSI